MNKECDHAKSTILRTNKSVRTDVVTRRLRKCSDCKQNFFTLEVLEVYYDTVDDFMKILEGRKK